MRTRSKPMTSNAFRKKHNLKPVRLPDYPDYGAPVWERQEWRHRWGNSWFDPMVSYPAWWDRVFHSKPRRARERQVEFAILAGRIDPVNVFPALKDGDFPSGSQTFLADT